MTEFINFELLLLNKIEKREEVLAFYEHHKRFPEQTVQILTCIDNLDFYYIYNIVINNFDRLVSMTTILENYYILPVINTSTKNGKYFKNIVGVLTKIAPNQNNIKTLCWLISVWFLISFNISSTVFFTEKPQYCWANKYEIISNIFFIFTKFSKKLSFLSQVNINKINHESEVDLKELIWSMLYTLVNSFLIKEFEWKVKQGEDNTKYKSSHYLGLTNWVHYYNNQICVRIYTQPLNVKHLINNEYVIEDHYLSIRDVIKRNKYSNTNSILGNHYFFIERSSMKLFINWDFFKFLKPFLLEKHNINKEISDEHFSKILTEKKEKFWAKKYQREFAHLFSLNYFFHLEKLEKYLQNGMYFRYYFDFRGRFYTDSPIGYTHNRFFRYLYNYGYYTSEEVEKFSLELTLEDVKYAKLITSQTNIKIEYPNINYNSIVVLYYIEIIFFQIGKLFKTKINAETGDGISYGDFVMFAIKYFNEGRVFNDKLESQIEYWSLIFILKDLNRGFFPKTPIFHDATASAIQILLLVLGSKNAEHYKMSNLIDETKWYDTYQYIINKFLQNENISSDCEHYFSRKNLKQTIMTFNYNATYLKCWKEFVEMCFFEKTADKSILIKLENYFKNFYQFLKKIFHEDGYFEHAPKIIGQYFDEQFFKENNFWFVTEDNFNVYLKYFSLKLLKRTDKIVPGQVKTRRTIQWYSLSDECDIKKTKRAVQANFVHLVDGFIIRALTQKFEGSFITIHDSIGVPVFLIKKFKKVAITVMQNLYEENLLKLERNPENLLKINSLFIFL